MTNFINSSPRTYFLVRYLLRFLYSQTSPQERKLVWSLLNNYETKRLEQDQHCSTQLIIHCGNEEKKRFEESKQLLSLENIYEIAYIAIEELYLDHSSIIALLLTPLVLNDVIELEQLKDKISEDTFKLVNLLVKTSDLFNREESVVAENFDKLLLSMAEDIRVILLIIANRFYRLRYARHHYPEEVCQKLAQEVKVLYAPIAHKLGLYTIKGEMEDLCLKYLEPEQFQFIKQKLGDTKDARDRYIQEFLAPVKATLDKQLDYPYKLKARTKSISSINNKLKHQEFEDIYDLFAIRIIIDAEVDKERQACWQAYSLITDMYLPNPKRLKDWLSIPKTNGYESLHITVMGAEGKWVEVQIRTKRMDIIAEQGVAAHWRYKGVKSNSRGMESYLSSVRDSLEALKEEGNECHILEHSKLVLEADEIYVFTPKGEVFKLPVGATVLDYAFAVHSRVGATAMSAKVNGRNVSIKEVLKNGDSIEVKTSSQQKPSLDWLSIVVSNKAKSKIRQIIRQEEEKEIMLGREVFERRLKNRKITLDEGIFNRLLKKLGYKKISNFYKDLMNETLEVGKFLERYEEYAQELESISKELSKTSERELACSSPKETSNKLSPAVQDDVLVIGEGLTGVVYDFAKCCSPRRGDSVYGIIGNSGIKIHKVSCPNSNDLLVNSARKFIPVKWFGSEDTARLVVISVEGYDQPNVLSQFLIGVRNIQDITILNYKVDCSGEKFQAILTLNVAQYKSLEDLFGQLPQVEGVERVQHLNASPSEETIARDDIG